MSHRIQSGEDVSGNSDDATSVLSLTNMNALIKGIDDCSQTGAMFSALNILQRELSGESTLARDVQNASNTFNSHSVS